MWSAPFDCIDTLMTHVNYHSILQIIILTKRKIDISFSKIKYSRTDRLKDNGRKLVTSEIIEGLQSN